MTLLDPQSLRQKHLTFWYRKADYQFIDGGLRLKFTFELEYGPTFTPTVFLANISESRLNSIETSFLQNLTFQIGLVEMLSYWKAAVSPKIVIQAGYLSTEQLPFWRNLLHKGLSEFFFVNQLNGWQTDFVQIKIDHLPDQISMNTTALANQVLIPVGGGKDSAVSLELAKELLIPVAPLTLNLNSQVQKVLALANLPEHIEITRQIDPQLFALNSQGYLNGHTPFSALLGFISVLAAVVYDYKYVAVSNEWSANEGNTIFLGQKINHQYSKTFEFETDFRSYVNTFLSSEVEYFSWLRPLSELQISKLFSRNPHYFSKFLSCNRGQKTGQWCGVCPKCLFVFLMLSAFLPPDEVQLIWGQDLMTNLKLEPILLELTGQTEVKSLECVGTRQETLYAIALTLHDHPELQSIGLWPIGLAIIHQQDNLDKVAEQARASFSNYENDMYLPPQFRSILKEAITYHD